MRFTSWKKVTYRLLATVISDRVCIHTICREPWVRSQDCECSISSTLQCAVYKRSTPSPSLSDCLPRWQAVSAYFLSDLFLFHLVNGILVSPVISSNMCLFFRWNLEPSSTMFSSLMMQSLPKNLGRAPGERQRWALKLVMFYLFNCICSYQLSFSQLCSTIYGLQKKEKKKCKRSEHWWPWMLLKKKIVCFWWWWLHCWHSGSQHCWKIEPLS